MDKLNNIVNNYKENQEKYDNNKEETIKQLLVLRKRAIRLVDNANKTLQKRCSDLKSINETICKVQGHTYTDWEEHEGFLDRSWYYTRECEFCGIKERVENEPVDFKNQQLKKKLKK